MKKLKKLFALVFVLCLLAGITVSAFAADTYYTVRVYAGQRGTIGGSTVKAYTVKSGDTLTITNNIQNYVTITDTSRPYYATGIRESGKEETHALSFTVTKDEDFVVTYGVRGQQVAYYVRYINRNTGAQIGPGQEGPFYVNTGDRVYVGYVDINNYTIANARNLTKTMTGDFTFVFEYVPATGGGQGAQGGAAQGGQAAGGQGAVAGQGNQGGNAAGGQGAAGAQGAAAPEAPAVEPEEIIDLDVPLAEPEGTAAPAPSAQPEPAKKPSRGPVIAGVAAGVAAVGGLYWFLLVHRKKKKAEAENELDFDDDEFDDKK